jgi:hypothetical protein
VDTYRTILYLHLVSLAIGFGAGAVLMVCRYHLKAAQTLEEAVPWATVAGKTEKAFPVAIVGLYGSGAYMTQHFWTWGTSWIVLPIVGLAVLSLQGPLVAGKRGHAVGAALMANGPGPLGPEARTMTRDLALWWAAFSNEGLVLGIVWVMTNKPGWGGGIAALLVAYAVGVAFAWWMTRPVPAVEAAPAPESA